MSNVVTFGPPAFVQRAKLAAGLHHELNDDADPAIARPLIPPGVSLLGAAVVSIALWAGLIELAVAIF